MKREKGFTLIELLAVIVIIGLIAVITIPKVKETIKDSEEKTYKISVQTLLKDATNYYVQKRGNNTFTACKYDFETGINECQGLEYTGELPTSGVLQITNKGKVNVSVKYKDKCYSIGTEHDLEITDYDANTCGNKSNVVVNYQMPSLTSSGDGLYESSTEPGRFIYRGANPNNYITLNEGTASSPSNVTYRIMSYEKDGTIKVIRDTSTGKIAWDSNSSNTRQNTNNTYCNYTGTYYGCNVWGNLSNTFYNGSTLGNTFNYKYYANNTNTELTNSTDTGTVTVDSTLNQYLNNTWIANKEMSKYIDNHDFNVGGVYYASSYTGGDKGLQKEKSEEKLYTWNGKIGLMNITDYVDASLNPECTSVYSNFYYNTNYYYESSQHISGYDNWPCSNRTYNWLPKAITEWSLSPISSNCSSVWRVDSAGYFYNSSAYGTTGVRPAFYLKSSVSLTGTGTSSDPYRISN